MVTGLSAEQVQRLLSLIDTPKPSCDRLSGNSDWLLDSGATCHMTVDLKQLTKLHDIHPIFVKMPNGQSSVARKQGMVKLNSNITLHDVLFVPGLTCNLISIVQLINDLVCIVTFTPNLCVIHDLSLRTPTGVGEQRRGVYLLQESLPEEARQTKWRLMTYGIKD